MPTESTCAAVPDAPVLMAAGSVASFDVLGIPISAVDLPRAVTIVEGWITGRTPRFVCFRDVHGVMAARKDPALRDIHTRAGLVAADGMPLVWLGRLQGRQGLGRVCGPDFMATFCRYAARRGYRHYFYGGAPGVNERLIERLRGLAPGIAIAGHDCPPFRELTAEEDAEAVRRINESGADVVWVGLGSPKQERWMAAHVGRVNAPALMGVGAAFDFLAGTQRRAPRWMQRNGLEWLFRLLSEPRRLWRRYLVMAPLFIAHVALDALGLGRRRESRPPASASAPQAGAPKP